MHPAFCLRRLEYNAHARVQDVCDSAEHTERVAFVGRRFQPADLLLRCSKQLGELHLREPGPLAQRGYLQRDIPRFTRVLKTRGEQRIF